MWIHFYERFKQNPVCRKFLAETGVRPNYSSRVINAKIKPFHFLKQSCLFNNLCWGVSICWRSCSANGSWRGWSLTCEDFTRSLEELGALGSTEEAGARGLVKSWSLWFLSLGLKIHKGRVGWGNKWSSPFWQRLWKTLLFTPKWIFLPKKTGFSYGSEMLNFSFVFVHSPSVVRGIATSLYWCLNLWGSSSLSHQSTLWAPVNLSLWHWGYHWRVTLDTPQAILSCISLCCFCPVHSFIAFYSWLFGGSSAFSQQPIWAPRSMKWTCCFLRANL